MPDAAYEERRFARDAEYLLAWEKAPESFRKAAESAGVEGPELDRTSQAMEYEEGYLSASTTPDMARDIDTHVDELVEKHGVENEELVRAVAADLKKPMDLEIERGRSLMLGRVVMHLVRSETSNVLAGVHGLMHAIPRLAAANGFTSMRKSALACNVSQEWIRKSRNRWCHTMGVEIPVEGRKSPEACAKYSKCGKENHWTRQKFTDTPTKQCQTNLPQKLQAA